MSEGIIKHAVNLIHCIFIPVECSASNTSNDSSSDNIFDRFKAAVVPSQYDGITPEIANFIGWVQHGFIFGVPMGAIVQGKNQYMEFMEQAKAYQYKSHLDAKAAISSKMIQGALRGAYIWGVRFTILAATYGFLLNTIPILRNDHSWQEYIISATVTGVLGGHFFSNRTQIGFEEVKLKGRLTYRQLALLRGTGCGLLFGVISAVYANMTGSRSSIHELRKWETYWRQKQQNQDGKNTKDVKAD